MKRRFYIVWEGRHLGIFDTWEECEKQVKGYKGAKYKSYESLIEAQKALGSNYEAAIQKKKFITTPWSSLSNPPILESITVDGAHNNVNHLSEYQGVYTKTGEKLFHKGPFYGGSNNIMEFLAIVHALALCKQRSWNVPIYSDSKTAIQWIKNKTVKTTIQRTSENQAIFQLLDRAVHWLQENTYENPILKWDTQNWGENPADFGRK